LVPLLFSFPQLDVKRVQVHGLFTSTLCTVFVLYLLVVLAFGNDQEVMILAIIFCTVTIDIWASYRSLQWCFAVSRFERHLKDHEELIDTAPFVPGDRWGEGTHRPQQLPMHNISQSSSSSSAENPSCGGRGGGGGGGSRVPPKSRAEKKKAAEASYAESRSELSEKLQKLSNLGAVDDAPSQFVCPISMSVMIDPVICDDGNTYERKEIVTWLKNHNKSPVTNLPLNNRRTLIQNIAIRSRIEEWCDEKVGDIEKAKQEDHRKDDTAS